MNDLIFFFVILFTCSHGLKIFEDGFGGEHKTYDHNTADFGPEEKSYNVSGPFKLMSPFNGCNINKYKYNRTLVHENGTHTQISGYLAAYNNSIVLIERGNCTFSQKTYNAYLLGAVGVVIGDNVNGNEWISMQKSGSNEITIPSVFVPTGTKNKLVELFDNTTTTTTTATTSQNENSNDNDEDDDVLNTPYPTEVDKDSDDSKDGHNDNGNGNSFYVRREDFDSYNNLGMGDMGSYFFGSRQLMELNTGMNSDGKIIYAMLDKSGEYDSGLTAQYSQWLTVIGLIILLIPTLWCLLGSVMMARKVIKNCVNRHRRWKQLHSIPIVRYQKREECDGDGDSEDKLEDGIIGKECNIHVDMDKVNSQDDKDGLNLLSKLKSKSIDGQSDDKIGKNTNTNKNTSKNHKNNKQKPYESVASFDDDCVGNDSISTTDCDLSLKQCSKVESRKSKLKATRRKSFTHRLISQTGLLHDEQVYQQPLNSECVICLDDFEHNDRVKLLPCLHGFHPRCIDPWLHMSSEECPMCKQSIFNSTPRASKSEIESRSGGLVPLHNTNSDATSNSNGSNIDNNGDKIKIDESSGNVAIGVESVAPDVCSNPSQKENMIDMEKEDEKEKKQIKS